MKFNVYPLYICNKERECNRAEGCGGEFCNYTTCPSFAKNPEAVEIYNKFFDTFDPIFTEENEFGTQAIIGYKEKENK